MADKAQTDNDVFLRLKQFYQGLTLNQRLLLAGGTALVGVALWVFVDRGLVLESRAARCLNECDPFPEVLLASFTRLIRGERVHRGLRFACGTK